MKTRRRKDEKEPITQLTILLPTAERNLIQQAVQVSGSRSLSAFVRKVAVDQAQTILGREPVNPAACIAPAVSGKARPLHAYIGPTPPESAVQPAIAFPSIRNFATVFSDRNRATLRYLAHNAPRSISELSQQIGYPLTALRRSLSCLAGYGVTAYYSSGSGGQHLTPYLLRQSVRLVLPLSGRSVEEGLFLTIGIQSAVDESLPERTDKVFSSINGFAAALPMHSLTLLHAIAGQKPNTAEQLAHLTGVTGEALYRTIKGLNRLRLITVHGRRPMKPTLAYDGLVLELVFVPERSEVLDI